MHGNLIIESPNTIVRTIARAKRLELVFINGCMTAALGKALVAAGVRRVICWETIVADKHAKDFSILFYTTVKQTGCTYEEAFTYASLVHAATPHAKTTTLGVPRMYAPAAR